MFHRALNKNIWKFSTIFTWYCSTRGNDNQRQIRISTIAEFQKNIDWYKAVAIKKKHMGKRLQNKIILENEILGEIQGF